MKYLSLIWAGLWRKPVRTVLTLASITVAFMLFGILDSVTGSIDTLIEDMSETRLRTTNRINIIEPLPYSYVSQIENVEGVESVAFYSIFYGYHQDPSNGMQIGAVDIERFDEAFPEAIISPEHREAMVKTRTGAIVGEDLMAEEGWSVGDRIPLTSRIWRRQDGSNDWAFDIVGTYRFDEDTLPAEEVWINYAYFDEERTNGNGTVHLLFEVVDSPDRAAPVAERIDALFRNSPAETESASEQEFLRAQINQVGDIDFIITSIIGAVLFTLLFLTGNTMMQSIRERIPELAVLKTYGFSDAAVISLVCAEALILCGVSAALGLTAAAGVFPSIFESIGAPPLPMPWTVIAAGFGVAAALALVSAVAPAYRVRRLKLVDALAGR